MTTDEFLPALLRGRLVAIIRGTDGKAAVAAARALFEEGISYVEITLTTPGALEAIETLGGGSAPGHWVGAGSVITAAQASDAAAAGARFIVTPGVTESVAAAVRLDVPVLAGAYTATEAVAAMAQGAAAVKLFPASAGGPGYLKALRDPLPRIPFIAVGGVGLADAPGYFQAGAVALGLGGPLVGNAATQDGDLAAMRERARNFVELAGPDRMDASA
ncbi:bifunctional 4-hydroxy-2-oxoglutarate aldolase/2-dehydro-3-deoxy-phosphogluconate aldolase [Arthrobacter zhangbolii]|uniref:Bifunctional 4-hydroxy-2-oxoglutarate aldolase/2-dehydro-3-deoxy-phosphogluconate aldolase n=1 Tax=Arthrobacter zhangbolii TaxID=2886936 RepID=A0A9X1S9F2_9MICC|nr:bifunctional 4-hydroxy-2-oxoglutarate aldolase/2-dehydro-3-deoxy-phosphogluconate aldolase [Arthrobacter zhangbolii]MCC3273028.1 bifunctional 4-hydroxy-2-oxoglutarate aldolase/2-dehydro-3-deoxy-phosphogluconate aldolase [Arthrobacter zhangbolii]MCC3295369.1 bifunctional 4-hydroxy-2-oxoglutarate aldolase/2-dehydro-3-deoxy-phosphogluconate aldolase [Arthrobacter zhangbolii]UON93078.1 bifunctional 4-hydroxy-2-oxoglutarate aldolase/2-dehydro-3-deoxy-phosphogluconate aldolase [Arthrobacter zhangbo